jgi:hypothetical protein
MTGRFWVIADPTFLDLPSRRVSGSWPGRAGATVRQLRPRPQAQALWNGMRNIPCLVRAGWAAFEGSVPVMADKVRRFWSNSGGTNLGLGVARRSATLMELLARDTGFSFCAVYFGLARSRARRH